MQELRPLVAKALTIIKPKTGLKQAIDFGIGRGDETSYLLREGYTVIAIDNFEEFLTEVRLREDTQPFLDRLTTVHTSFEDLDWSTIPQVDLFVASFSLCFVQPDQFHRIWKQIVSHIKPGGYFVGHLYTHLQKNTQVDGYYVTEHSESIPFFTEQEIKALFNEFTIEYFEDAAALYDKPIDNVKQNERIYSAIAQRQIVPEKRS